MVAVLAGMPNVPGTAVNRYCSSSLQTIRMAAHAIKAGEGDVFLAGGVECVSRYSGGGGDATNPKFAGAVSRTAERTAGGQPTWTPNPGLPDMYIAMGQTAENVREIEGVTREEMDAFAYQSQQRAAAAIASGFYEREIVPITLPDGTVIAADDCPRADTTLEGLAKLKAVFRPDGQVTAGNSCPLNDGAAFAIVMSDVRAAQLGITPIARIVSSAVTGLDAEIMGLGPIEACRLALRRAGLTMEDIDLVEINEAFAAQAVPCQKQLGIDPAKLNAHGGAIALGHPFGMTGARIMATLLNGLEHRGGRYGLESMCVAGGMGMAMVVERLA
jgi:acetyl-CoA C-acetyltransferase